MTIRIKEGFRGQRSVELPANIVEKEKDDPITAPLYVTYIGFFPHAEYHYVDRTQAIDDYVLIYCVEGRGHYRVRGNEYVVDKNQYFILPASESHLYWSDREKPWTIYWVHFNGNLAGYYVDDTIIPHTIKPGLSSHIAYRNEVFEEIFATLEDSFDTNNLRYATSVFTYYLASMHFLQLYRKALNKKEGLRTIRFSSEEKLVDAAIHYINENIEHPILLDDITKYIGYSKSQFTRIFKKNVGQTPLNYINGIRIKKACTLLGNSNMKINQVCFKVGINDNLYFSKVFKKVTGLTPSDYRIMHKQQI